MANQSIGTPVFFMDFTQLAKTKGFWKDITEYDLNNTNGIYELDQNGNPVYGEKNMNVWNFDYSSPTNYSVQDQNYFNFRLGFWNPFNSSEWSVEWAKLISTTNWAGVINHNLCSSFPYDKTSSYINATCWNPGTGQEIIFDKTDSVNGSTNVGTSYGISYDGYSIIEGNFPNVIYPAPGVTDERQYSAFLLSIVHQGGLEEYPRTDFDIGAIAFGKKIEMPNAPDLKVIKSIEYDGITIQRSLGGADYVQVNHLGCPDWLNGEPFSLSNATDKGRIGKNGRRRWSMQFSYIANDKLFYNINESNIAGETIFDDDGNAIEFRETNEIQQIWDLSLGGALPFIFCPDKDAVEKEFCICRLDQQSIKATQVAHNTWNVGLNIYEVW